MDGAEPRAGQHRDDGLGDHRHVDDHAIALPDAEARERAGEAGGEVAKLRVAENANLPGHRAVVDQRGPLAGAALDVPVERVEAGVQHAAGEPAVERRRESSRTRSKRRIQSMPSAASAQKESGSRSERACAFSWASVIDSRWVGSRVRFALPFVASHRSRPTSSPPLAGGLFGTMARGFGWL